MTTSQAVSARRDEVGRAPLESGSARSPSTGAGRAHRSSSTGRPREIRHSNQPVPDDEHADEHRPVEDRLLDRSRAGSRSARRRADDHRRPTPAATMRTSSQPGWEPRGPRVNHDRPRAGSRSARPGPCRHGRLRGGSARPVLGRWKVTVRSARTAGSDGSPLDRSMAVGVSTATTGMPPARARSMSSTADRIGSRSGPRTPVPSSASTMTAARSMPVAEDRDVAGDGGVDLG